MDVASPPKPEISRSDLWWLAAVLCSLVSVTARHLLESWIPEEPALGISVFLGVLVIYPFGTTKSEYSFARWIGLSVLFGAAAVLLSL